MKSPRPAGASGTVAPAWEHIGCHEEQEAIWANRRVTYRPHGSGVAGALQKACNFCNFVTCIYNLLLLLVYICPHWLQKKGYRNIGPLRLNH